MDYGKYDQTEEQRNKETMSIVKLQVIIILDLNELRWRNCPDKLHC